MFFWAQRRLMLNLYIRSFPDAPGKLPDAPRKLPDAPANVQTYKHTNVQTYKHTNIQTYKNANMQTRTRTNVKTYKHTSKSINFDIPHGRHTGTTRAPHGHHTGTTWAPIRPSHYIHVSFDSSFACKTASSIRMIL